MLSDGVSFPPARASTSLPYGSVMAHGRQAQLLCFKTFYGSSTPRPRSEPQSTSVNATTCRVQEKEQDRTGALRVRKLLLVKVENSQVLTSQRRFFSGRILMPSYEPQMQVVSLLRHKSPTKEGEGPCIRSTLGRMAAVILRVDSGGVDSKTPSCRYRVLLTADDICVKVLD